MADPRPQNATPVLGAVLAGGTASRMGGSKAMAQLAGRPLVCYPLAAVAQAGLDALIVAKANTELPEVDVPVLRERAEETHPLHGVVEALHAAGGRPVVVIACDMPFVTAELIAWLAGLSGLAVPRLDGRLHPLLARYEANALGALARSAGEGRSAQEAIRALEPRLVDRAELARFGDPRRLLMNVNTPQDLERASAILAQGGRTRARR